MAPRRTLSLTDAQRQALVDMMKRHPKPYLRVRAAALLKVAEGHSARWVAQHGLLEPIAVDTLYRWLDRYQEEGIDGLVMRPGRGRKPAFSPSPPNA